MFSFQDLDDAVDAGIIDQAGAERLRQFLQQRTQVSSSEDEHVRLISGFNDLFVVIACLLLLYGASALVDGVYSGLGGFTEAAIAWGLSLYFVAKKRMALPAVVLLLVYVIGLYQGSAQLLFDLTEYHTTLAGIIAASGAWLHWRTFRVPITVAAGAVAVIAGLAVSLLAAFPDALTSLHLICFVAGLGLFVWALSWDFSDRERQSGRSDVAFWLHLASSPLMVHPIFFISGAMTNEMAAAQAVAIVVLYLAMSVVSLLIDRRALLVSALVYLISALVALFNSNGFVDQSTTITLIVVGAVLIALSVGWRTLRAKLVPLVPDSWQQRLPTVR